LASPLDDVCFASLPEDAMPFLAEVRCLEGVEVMVQDRRAWVRWPAGNEAVLRCLLPVPGVELYVSRHGLWFRPGANLPSFEVPDLSPVRPLVQVLTPAPIQPVPPAPVSWVAEQLRLVRDTRPRSATALYCDLRLLTRWAETATSAALSRLEGACLGDKVLVRGQRLPPLADAERFWGCRVLIPLGFRQEPDWAESALAEALGLGSGELILLRSGSAVVVPENVLGRLCRASVRRALRHGST
jgi:hypothetical protein